MENNGCQESKKHPITFLYVENVLQQSEKL